jgi:DNA-binding GntR family transcriptional regulator
MTGIIVRNLSDQVVDLVRDRILAGIVPLDQAIRQDALAAELGVSKIPLREALTRLEQEGLVRSQPNRGFFVRALNAAEAEEVYALRLKLEPETVAVAALRANEEEREAARAALTTLEGITHKRGEVVGTLNRAFHLTLIRPSKQPITSALLGRLHVMCDRYVRKHLEPLGRDQRANDEHREILASWLDRDAERVVQHMSAHIGQTLDDLRGQLEPN